MVMVSLFEDVGIGEIFGVGSGEEVNVGKVAPVSVWVGVEGLNGVWLAVRISVWF